MLAADNDGRFVYDDEELAEIAREIADGGKEHGSRGSLMFLMADKGGYTLVAFMDNTVMQGSMATLFRYTCVFGGGAILLLFFLAIYLAKKIVKPLEESYRRQKQFISDAGHELKTPVSIISANAELLAREAGSSQWLSNIQYENERMGVLVAQLLELVRTENVSPRMECIDLGRLVSGEALPFESVAFENGVTLESSVADGVQVSGNSIQLRQLISILLDNAIRHCGHGGTVGIVLAKGKNAAFLSVINDGEEIPKEQREKIFERFYRADQARNSESGNYGLGLAIAKAVVTAHRGRIEVLCHEAKVEFAVRIPLQK
ncbi:HAMP domain-containing histidine kinase [Petralouisia muris]|uniref:HAMP domain-containing histidine kinase n=2 Tax=Petralouisia muris TaxID=3032872 RepID=A0AC61RTJ2_9FIRM|nr:HAMP domain-containing histidine kinase [Petralouisia muris]